MNGLLSVNALFKIYSSSSSLESNSRISSYPHMTLTAVCSGAIILQSCCRCGYGLRHGSHSSSKMKFPHFSGMCLALFSDQSEVQVLVLCNF